MNNTTHSISRWLLCLLVILGVMCAAPAGFAGSAGAGQPVLAKAAPAPLFGSFLSEAINDRTRLIQVSFIFVGVGILLLWKK